MAKFRARARTLDMLGKQQIAGIPTALHELFKNAYDAYASVVDVDFYRKSSILMLRDDGIGMSLEDFENRWLTIGTESKLGLDGITNPSIPSGVEKRPTMGEKGIGRLAIATIGPIVLVITRSRHPKNRDTTVSLIHWGLFEIPGVDLDEINIPVRTISQIEDLSEDLVREMRNEILESVDEFAGNLVAATFVAGIQSSLKKWELPVSKLTQLSYGPTLSDDGSGTHFIIHPVGEELAADIDEKSSSGATNLERMLLGFSDELYSDESSPLQTHFRDHLEDGQIIDRIGEQQFFTRSEFEIADHKVEGTFDEKGNFKGRISIYRGDYKDFEIPLFSTGEKRVCGPFDISFAYVQGARRDSKIPQGIYEPLTAKLDRIGGLYIYKNGIRVLPYGNSDYDFLEIERRRTLSASYYFFSYRRMFGAIHTDAKANGELREKAGREGFQSNKAYRQFREQLMLLFEELAARFFREDGAFAEEWALERDALQKEHAIAQKRQKSVRTLRAKLSASLASYFDKVSSGAHVDELNAILDEAKERVSALLQDGDLEDVAVQIIAVEAEMTNRLQEFLESYRISRPGGIGLTKTLARHWEQYQRSYTEDIVMQLEAVRGEAEATIGKLASEAKVHLDAKMRLRASLAATEDYSRKALVAQRKSTEDALTGAEKYVKSELSNARIILQETKDEIDNAIAEFEFEGSDEEKLESFRTSLERKLVGARKQFEERLDIIRARLDRVRSHDDEDDILSDEAVAALETQLEVLKDDYAQTLELAQLGMAVSIVQHEFEANVRGVRRSLRSMQKWANRNEGLRELYEDIRDGFDHLDNYLSLFTPLDRRLRRRKTQISGEQIGEFLRDLFGERFTRHSIQFTLTKTAADHHLESYASVILPVFVNLIDNSIYWLSKKDGAREITLDAHDETFVLSDNGPGISELDKEFIFEFGYSKKYGGQGMGLYIAKTSLNKEDLDIRLVSNFKSGAKFEIGPMEAAS